MLQAVLGGLTGAEKVLRVVEKEGANERFRVQGFKSAEAASLQ